MSRVLIRVYQYGKAVSAENGALKAISAFSPPLLRGIYSLLPIPKTIYYLLLLSSPTASSLLTILDTFP